MNNMPKTAEDVVFQRRAMEAAIRIGLVVLLVVWCFNIVQPFIMLVLWGAIFAVAIYPLFLKFSDVLKGRQKTAAAVITLVTLAMLITPT